MDFHNFYASYVFKVKESTAGIPTELPCLNELENPSQLSVREELMILSYNFSKFSHYSCFRGQGIHCWYLYKATMVGDLENPGRLPVQHVLEGTVNALNL